MITAAAPTWLLEQETRALLTRLASVKPIVLQETCVAAAAPSPAALSSIEEHLSAGRVQVRRAARDFLRWLSTDGAQAPVAEQQRRFVVLRLGFQATLTQFDMFSEVITQRSEVDNGVLLSGLDVAAAEALLVPGRPISGPPVLCSLHRGLGGSIRRARTRLPGGGENPVALIRIPRERIIGFGVSSSLVHEVGHQVAALLGLVESLRAELADRGLRRARGWELWWRTLPEVVADLWAIGKVGIGSTLGLIGLVSLPRAFVFRLPDHDPHPMPWVRVLLSCAIGDRLYPDPQWRRLAGYWRSMYPLAGLARQVTDVITDLLQTLPDFVSIVLGHRPALLGGRSLAATLRHPELQRERLLQRFTGWESGAGRMAEVPPSLAFAVLGQARASGRLSPERESRLLRRLITTWAVDSSLEIARAGARRSAGTFVGQPTIWTDHPVRPRRLLRAG